MQKPNSVADYFKVSNQLTRYKEVDCDGAGLGDEDISPWPRHGGRRTQSLPSSPLSGTAQDVRLN